MARESASARSGAVSSRGITETVQALAQTRIGDQVEVDFARADSRLAADLARTAQMARAVNSGLSEIGGMLDEVKGLVSDIHPDKQVEVDAILAGVDRVAGSTTTDGTKLLDGSLVLRTSEKVVAVAGASTEHLGIIDGDEHGYRLKDLKTGGRLVGNTKGGDVMAAAIGQVKHAQSALRDWIISAPSDTTASQRNRDITEYSQQVRERALAGRGVDVMG